MDLTLFDAAMAGDAAAIAQLEMEADRLFQDEETILHLQSQEGNTERVRFILREFPHKNLLTKLTRYNHSALHLAIYRGGHKQVAEILIDAARHLPPPPPSDGDNNSVTSFQAFLRQGDKDVDTALHAAVKYGHLDIVKLLVEADPTDTHIQNDDGKTPMYIAVEQGNNDMVEIISTTCTAPSLLGPRCSALVRTKDMEQAKSPGGSLYKIMDKDALYAAAIARDADAIAALEMHADKVSGYSEETILHTESENGNTEHVRFILREFADKNLLVKLNKYKQTALHLALSKVHTEVAEILIDAARHLPPSANDNPVTSFQAFLRLGDKDMDTALHIAVINNHIAIVKLLLEADPGDTHVQNHKGKTPLYIAVEKGYNDIVEIISTTCPAQSLDGPDGNTALRIKNLDQGKNPGGALYEIYDIKAVLYAAAIAGDADAIAKLETEADILNKDEETILHVESKKGNLENVRFILREFAHKNLLVKLDNQKETALTWAAYFGHTEVAEVLIDAARNLPPSDDDNPVTSFQAFLRLGDKDMDTALHIAVINNHIAIVKLLVEADPSDTHIQNNDGKTPIYIAVKKGYKEIVKLICTSCTAPSLKGPGVKTALHAAIKDPDHDNEVVEILIGAARLLSSDDDDDSQSPVSSFQAFLRQGDKDMNTALHIAVMQGNLATTKILLEADPSDPHLPNNKGETPMYIAAEKGYSDIVKMICTTCTSPSNLDGPCGTALHAAIKNLDQDKKEDIDVIRMIIKAMKWMGSGEDSDSDEWDEDTYDRSVELFRKTDENRCTCLELAVDRNYANIVGLILAENPIYQSWNAPDFIDLMPLIYRAMDKEYTDIVKLLTSSYERGADITYSYDDMAALISAIKGRKRESVFRLLDDCADELVTFVDNLDGPAGSTTALHAAIMNIHQAKEEDRDVIRMMIDAAKRGGNAEDRPNVSFEALFNKTDMSGHTVLELAVDRNYVDTVELILRENPAYQHGHGSKNSLMRLIYKAIDKEYTDIVRLLSETYEAGITTGHKGVVALIIAINRRDEDSVIRILGEAKHLVTFADDEGWTPLHYAAYQEFVSILDVIIKALKDVKYQFVYGDMVSTPFHLAAECKYTSTVIRLMQSWPASSSAYTAVNKNGQNILHLAATNNKKEMIQGILKYCPEKYKDEILEQQDANGDTPLHLLISNGCFIPELIKHKGLDTMAKNKKKWTPRDMLYFQEEIIADQVQIKIALDDVQTTKSWKFWVKNMEKKTDIDESSVCPSRRETKDVIFNEEKKLLMDAKHGRMKKDLERYKKRTNTQIIVTALITTVTFTVGFTMPGGLHQSGEVDEGLVVLTRKTAFNAFMVSDALALLLSTCSLFLYFLESMYEDPHQVSKLNAASVGLNIVSIMAMMLTFITGTYLVLSHSLAIAITVCLIGSFFFIFVIVLLIKLVYDRQVKRNED
ncbi:hypothetical protein ACET3Z_005021 [Daucus carota]